MTHEILQTDIEFARSLLGGDKPAAEVVVALTRRGIEATAAEQLVDDLRNGRTIRPQRPASEWVATKRVRRHRNESQRMSSRPASSRSAVKNPGFSSQMAWIAAAIVVCLLVGGGVALFRHRPFYGGNTTEKPKPVEGAMVSAKSLTPVDKLTLDIRETGLYCGEALLNRENGRKAFADRLGPPTRTNTVPSSNLVIYAYDEQGVLVYTEQGAGVGSILLDFEGHGGVHGAGKPFKGTLKVADQGIRAETAPRELTSLAILGLKDREAEGGVFKTQLNGLEIIFSYLDSTHADKLSMVEISLLR